MFNYFFSSCKQNISIPNQIMFTGSFIEVQVKTTRKTLSHETGARSYFTSIRYEILQRLDLDVSLFP